MPCKQLSTQGQAQKRTSKEATVIIQGRDDGGLDQDDCRGGGEAWFTIAFADKLDRTWGIREEGSGTLDFCPIT